MAIAYNFIASSTVASPVATVTFSSIAGTYTDLKVVMSTKSSQAASAIEVSLTFNSNTTGYTAKAIYGDGSTAASNSPTIRPAGFTFGTSGTANTFNNTEIYIPNYASANYKSYSVDTVTETNTATGVYAGLMAGLWSNTAAITAISFDCVGGGNFVQYSSFYLYGINKS
jgi:hypothetical protein